MLIPPLQSCSKCSDRSAKSGSSYVMKSLATNSFVSFIITTENLDLTADLNFYRWGPSQASTEIFTKFKTFIFDTTDYKTIVWYNIQSNKYSWSYDIQDKAIYWWHNVQPKAFNYTQHKAYFFGYWIDYKSVLSTNNVWYFEISLWSCFKWYETLSFITLSNKYSMSDCRDISIPVMIRLIHLKIHVCLFVGRIQMKHVTKNKIACYIHIRK